MHRDRMGDTMINWFPRDWGTVCFAVQKRFWKKMIFFASNYFFGVFRLFWCANVKMNFKNWKKHYFDAFSSEKHFEKQSLPQCQTGSEGCISRGGNFDMLFKI